MKKQVFILSCLAAGMLCVSCDRRGEGGRVFADPNGTYNEQIAYHENEIEKYQKAYKDEKERSIKSLQTRHMSEVRRSNNKQVKYEKKIEEHQRAINEIQAKKGR